MRKTLLFMIFFCVHLLNAQENRIDELTKIEEKISTFISKNIDNFNLNELTETKLKNDYQKNTKDENIGLSSIKLNAIETIFCPKEKVFICGTYVIEENATVSSSNFKLLIPRDGYLDYEIHNPTLLDNNSFCFEVPIEAFGSTPNGTYEFIVTMQINELFVRKAY